MVAGEVSGDLLGADLIAALKKKSPDVEVYGIGGSRMIAEGFRSLYDMERLSVMGFVEVLGRLKELLSIRKRLARQLINDPPDAFVGIDAPDFNAGLEKTLKKNGIPSLHYVSPTVWAWRAGRLKKLKMAIDHMLVMFPFEMEYYEKHNIRATFVGHPVANAIPEVIDKDDFRKQLGISHDGILVALLPGSRNSEMTRLADIFVQAAARILKRYPDAKFVIPFAKDGLKQRFDTALRNHNLEELPVYQFDGKSREVLAASDIALLASGTAALESAVIRTPMVVAYKMNSLTAWLIRKFAYVKLFSMPNNLAGYELVPEFMQSDATPENLSDAVCDLLNDSDRMHRIQAELAKIYHQLRCNSGDLAAEAVIDEVRCANNHQTA
ncbi:MAG: lipid-A-disaccharide synthase [Proteobacteria bacterium]|nr:lipid-A-disaccharide synthase [Pseudomonadota bacterium]